MSLKYTVILWNQQKKRYDIILWSGIILLLTSFVLFQLIFHPDITLETLIIRATALCAVSLLHFILIIGPLCRISDRFLPLLYNRRHMGVSLFFIALIHGAFSIIQFHALGDTNPIASVFTSNQHYLSVSRFPFQILGFLALIILFFMAATSHDFWLKNLSPKVWKKMHMGVYVAFLLVILHIAFGALQYETSPVYFVLLIAGFITVAFFHLYSAYLEYVKKSVSSAKQEKYISICSLDEIRNNRAKTVIIEGEDIAIFKYDNKVSAVSNVCKHQMGPLGEGKVVDGCITCPWHGYQYEPSNGQSPPPFEEKLCTYRTKVINGIVWLDPTPLKEGTFAETIVEDYTKA